MYFIPQHNIYIIYLCILFSPPKQAEKKCGKSTSLPNAMLPAGNSVWPRLPNAVWWRASWMTELRARFLKHPGNRLKNVGQKTMSALWLESRGCCGVILWQFDCFSLRYLKKRSSKQDCVDFNLFWTGDCSWEPSSNGNIEGYLHFF